MTHTDRLLLIDDEPNVLEGLRRMLGQHYALSFACGGEEALRLLETEGPFAAAVCDLRMPGMHGLDVLREMRLRAPATVRLVLSGTADLDAAITAVNDGEVFRFHTKPVPTDVLLASIAAAVEHHHHNATPAAVPKVAEDFARALAAGEMRLYVQPQYDITRDRVHGAEALVRWQHPARGLLPPGAFLAEAEAADAIPALTSWMLTAACTAAAAWRRELCPDITIAVNITANDLADTDFPARVRAALAAAALPAAALELELVEGAALDAETVPRGALAALTAIGVTLSLDDFGTGYSAFGQLRRLPVKKLKIDRIFVADAATDASALRIVEAIVSLGKDLDLSVIAEGVETPEQSEALQRAGCKMVQGFLIARPMPAEDFPAWYEADIARRA
ncbi:EAL domain-containing protein [Oleispirillum naphthae]|uniref:two-component system response regulator n=1 Tax=Oleispirillum naphthae TaxID=2838853 RepID=UPI0030822B67